MAKANARNLTPKQEKFAQGVVINGGDKVKARQDAGYSMAMSKPSQCVDADNLYNHPKISPRIAELQAVKNKIAKEEFNIDAKWVLEQAVRVYDRCMQGEPIFNKDGSATGEWKFEHTGATKSLEIIGKHVTVNAFKEIIEHTGSHVIFNMSFNGAPIKK